MKFYTDTSYEIERNEEGESISITWTFKDYSNWEIQQVEKRIDADGNTAMMDWPVVNEDDLIGTMTATYVIPTEDRTTAYHADSHPHNHENETAYQEKYAKWWEDWQASANYPTFLASFRNLGE